MPSDSGVLPEPQAFVPEGTTSDEEEEQTMKKFIGLAVAGMVAASVFMAGGVATAAKNPATVHVLHAVPGAKVDVCVDDSEVRSNFTYKSTFTAELPAGSYKVAVRAAAAGECEGDVIKSATYDLAANKNYTVVAGLTGKGAPRLFAFKNNMSDIKDGVARVQVRHVAAAPTVDVWVNGAPAITGFTSGEEATVALPEGDYTVRVAPKGTTTTAIGPRTFSLSEGMAYQVFAVGSGDAGYRFLVLAQSV